MLSPVWNILATSIVTPTPVRNDESNTNETRKVKSVY